MDQRISFVTLAVADLAATRRFYLDGLGWTAELDAPAEVLMIRVGEHLVLSLWDEDEFEGEVGAIRGGPGIAPITLAHNVPTPADVDAVLDLARRADPATSRPGRSGTGGLHRVLRRSRRVPLGSRPQPRAHRAGRAAAGESGRGAHE